MLVIQASDGSSHLLPREVVLSQLLDSAQGAEEQQAGQLWLLVQVQGLAPRSVRR